PVRAVPFTPIAKTASALQPLRLARQRWPRTGACRRPEALINSGHAPHTPTPTHPRMPTPPADLFVLLHRLAIPHATVSHAPMFTVEQSPQLPAVLPARPTQ